MKNDYTGLWWNNLTLIDTISMPTVARIAFYLRMRDRQRLSSPSDP